jgi:hypothetical protein
LLSKYIFPRTKWEKPITHTKTNIRIEFTSTEMIWSEWQDEAAVYAETPFPYRIAIENQVVFIEYGESYSERFLALYTDRLLFLYDDDNSPPVFIGGEEFANTKFNYLL